MEDKGLPDFNGKVVIVYLANSPHSCDDGILLEYPRFIMRNERIFLSGRIPEIDEQEWVSSAQASVLWESVIHYLEFKSIDDYRSRLVEFRPTIIDRIKMLFG